MDRALQQHPLLDCHLQLLHCRHANAQLRIFSLSQFPISFMIWQGKIPDERWLILTVILCCMVCRLRRRLWQINTGEHRSNLKRKAKGMARSLAEVFAYLTFNTSSLEQSKKLLSIITNVSLIIMCNISIIVIIRIIHMLWKTHILVCSWIFSQPISSILHFAPWHNMCDAPCCQIITLFSKTHLQKVHGLCALLVYVHWVTSCVACSFQWKSSPWFLLDRPNRCYDTKRRKTAV